jgi:hypothetical protein
MQAVFVELMAVPSIVSLPMKQLRLPKAIIMQEELMVPVVDMFQIATP